MTCRHRLLLTVRLTYFMLCYFLLHVLLLVYSVHLLHYAAYIISDLCIAFCVAGQLTTGFWHRNFDFTGLSALGGVMQ
jgi:hypothetical protein